MAVGGPCHIEGCERPRMYNSPVCYKHKANAEDVWWVIEDEGGAVKPESRNLLIQEWSAEYEGRVIRVTNETHGKGVAKLYIDGELRDETEGEASTSIPRGEIWLSTELEGTGDTVDIRFKATIFSVKAKILVNKKQIGGDRFENSPINEKVDSSSSEVLKHGLLTKLIAVLLYYMVGSALGFFLLVVFHPWF
tara:strand:+ start:266 stop:844 length:579 start_codon:yes stop_codon:yes gene_type:complete